MSTRKLSELHPEFITIDGARGLIFDCPACGDSPPRSHSILVTWEKPSPFPSGAIWKLVNADLETLTLSPSIDLTVNKGECTFHGFVENGIVRW